MPILEENDIHEMYKKVKLPISYFESYNSINNIKDEYKNYDFPRADSLIDFQNWVNKYKLDNLNIIGTTCITDPELKYLNRDSIIDLSYPNYDLHKYYEEFENMFDIFVFCQTLEHLYNPLLGLQNIYKYVKKGGYVFTSVPTLNIPHLTPFHYGGFTPMGLGVLFVQAGFEIVEMGQWGNLEYITKLFTTFSWPSYQTLTTIENKEDYVCQCWILARKI